MSMTSSNTTVSAASLSAPRDTVEASRSAVSWAAIIAGAATAAAVSVLLLSLGSGIGLASVSPWQNSGASATTFAVSAAIWLIIVQWVASGLGGYMTGRLRTKWVGTHTDEVFFRDTAHGFLSWAVAAILSAFVLSSAVSSVVSGGMHALGGAASSAVQGASQGAASKPADPTAYLVDTLFRPSKPDASTNPADAKTEATGILLTSLRNGSMSPADRTYLAQLAAARTGISQEDAEKRVDEMVAQAKAAADKAKAVADETRKAASSLSFYTFFSMLIGAFVASAAAALGGQQRDSW